MKENVIKYYVLCNRLKNIIIIDDDSENKMDRYALEQMINSEDYKLLINDKNNVKKICKEKNIPLSFFYSRLAYDNIIKDNSKESIHNREPL